ncbi:MAG: cache domain-containing protein [Pseudomonadota bacterium]
MKSLGVILALALAGLQLFAVAVVVFSSFLTSERALLEHARLQLFDVGTNVIQHTRWFMSPARSATELSTALATNEIVRREERDHLEGLLFQQLRSAPQFAGAYYGDEDGNFVYVKRHGDQQYLTKIVDTRADAAQRTLFINRGDDFSNDGQYFDPEDRYDPRARPWYIEAKDVRGSIWTDPYIFFTSQSPGITAATPVIGLRSHVQGVVGVDIEIKALSSFLSELSVGKNGAAVILNRNGDVIAHPNPELLTTETEEGGLRFPSVYDIADPIVKAAFGDRLREDEVSVDSIVQSNFRHMDQDYVSLIMPFGLDDIPWTIVLYAPENDFIGAIIDNRRQNTAIAVAVVLTTALLGLALANRIHEPVRAFAVRSSLISQGEVDPNEPMPRTYKELEHANTTLVNEIAQRRKSEREYRLTFENASRAMAHIECTTGKLLRVNKSFCELLGFGTQELDDVTFQSLMDPSERETVGEFESKISGTSAFGFETKVIDKKNAQVWISFNGVFVQPSDQGSMYLVATIDDITQAHVSEEKIETLNRELARFSRHEMLDELATGLAHELNQPLTAITQNVDAAQSTIRTSPENVDALQEVLGAIEQQAHQASDIIKALRALVRKDTNMMTAFELRELLDQARRLVRPDARQHSVEIINTKGPELHVRAMRVQIAQVVVNLLRNAIEAIAEDGSARRIVRMSAEESGDFVLVCVEDTGPGIKDGVELFTPFETTKRDGMGMGLVISRSIIKANGGEMWYDGSTTSARFCFTLTLERQL